MSTVTIQVPDLPARVRLPEGNPGGIDDFARRVAAAGNRYEEFGTRATQASQVTDWFGDAYAAYSDTARTAATEHDEVAGTMRRVSRMLSATSDTLSDLQAVARRLIDHRADLSARRGQLLADIAAAQDVDPEVIRALQDRARSLTTEVMTLHRDIASLEQRTTANEDLMRQAFVGADTLGEGLAGGGGSPLATAAMGRPGAPGSGATPRETAAWWAGLSDAEQEALIAAYPSVIGRTDGLPATARDQANRAMLDEHLARMESREADGLLGEGEERFLENIRATRDALDSADEYVDLTTGERPGGQLWLYDPTAFDGDGRVAIAVGDLDTAEDVAVRTPGITNDMTKARALLDEAANVYESARFEGDGSSVASMMWMGYDAPDSFVDHATATEGRAAEGGAQLADSLDGLRAARPDDFHLTAIGHSYGSTTTAYAVADSSADVDDVVLVGSPGAGGDNSHATDLGIGRDHVWVGRNSRDIVGTFGDEGWIGKGGLGLGTDPSSEGFDAQRFEAEDVDRSGWHRGIEPHGNYFRPDTESLYNIGRIVDGQGGDVNLAEQSYDPWYDAPRDPEVDRTPSGGEEGRSLTSPDGDEELFDGS